MLYYEDKPTPIKEVDFGVDKYDEPKVHNKMDSLKEIFNNMFSIVPGTYPSQPEIGIDITKYLYRANPNMTELKTKIYENCSELFDYVDYSQIIAQPVDTEKGERIIVIIIPVTLDGDTMTITMGVEQGPLGEIIMQFQAKSDQ